jgi:triosephosphate isomerase (TIM)
VSDERTSARGGGGSAVVLRTPIIAGNWKMNHGPTQAEAFCRSFSEAHGPQADRTVALFPPAISLTTARNALDRRGDLLFGVQNIHYEKEGAFTGEISAGMARDAGAQLMLAGHSERRHIFGEADDVVGRKAAAALEAGLVPVICIGEKLDEREAGRLEEVLARQLDAALDPLPGGSGERLVIAYEPVWAIGTGRTATPEDAAAAHDFVRGRLRDRYGDAAAAAIPILYGGSVTPDNAAELLAASDVDGVLVGGASLDAGRFARIAAAG